MEKGAPTLYLLDVTDLKEDLSSRLNEEDQARFFARVISNDNCTVQEAETAASACFPDARIVRLDNPAYAGEFGLVTTLDKQSVLLENLASLSEKVTLGAVIRFS